MEEPSGKKAHTLQRSHRDDDIVTRRSINKSAYNKLQRSSCISFGRKNSIAELKSRFEPGVSKSSVDIDKSDIAKHTETGVNNNIDDDKKRSVVASQEENVIVQSKKNIEDLQGQLRKLGDTILKPVVPPKPTLVKRVSFSSDVSQIPIPAPRKSLAPNNAQVVTVDVIRVEKEVATPVLIKKIIKTPPVKLDEIDFAAPEDQHIISRASSEGSFSDFIESELSVFVMEGKPKETKRSNSFKRILKGNFFGKDRKKKDDDKKKPKKVENEVFADNAQNESFNKTTVIRQEDPQFTKAHAQNKEALQRIQNAQVYPKQGENDVERRYAQMHINRYNQAKASFDQYSEDYVCMDNGNKPTTNYINVGSVNKYIDTSSSSNTLDSENLNCDTARRGSDNSINRDKVINTNVSLRNKFFEHNYTDTPPRAQETKQNVQLVKPRAIIPINSERPLPNPYQEKQNVTNGKTIERNLNCNGAKEVPNKTNVYETKNEFGDGVYGTVYDRRARTQSPDVNRFSPRSYSSDTSNYSLNNPRLSPRSPSSLEGTKLRLPANREKIELQPRLKSPIPPSVVSTDKIIATELLKNKKPNKNDQLNSPSHQRLEIEIDYPEHEMNLDAKQKCMYTQNMETATKGKPPVSPQSKPLQSLEAGEWHRKQRELSKSPSLNLQNTQVTTNVMVHVDPHSPQNRSVTPIQDMRSRSITPVMMRSPSSNLSLQRTPPKHEIRQNVEAFCWKELKKMKEKEDMELQMQIQLTPFGYAEDPIISHRSRSMSPTSSRNSRRSTSLPREVQRQRRLDDSDLVRRQVRPQNPRQHQNEQMYGYIMGQQQQFVRNSPQRSTVGSYAGSDSSYRPIFKRGSLTHQANLDQQAIYNKKVSFHSPQNPENPKSWPTKNGYTQSPPQRRVDAKRESLEDEVFLPEKPVTEPIYGTKEQIQQQQRQLTREEIFFLNQQKQRQLRENTQVDGSRRPNEPIYGGREPMYASREPIYGTREAIYGTREPIYGSRGQIREPIYGSRPMPNINENELMQQKIESAYGTRRDVKEPLYGSKQSPNMESHTREVIYGSKANSEASYNSQQMYGIKHSPNSEGVYGSKLQNNESVYGTKQHPNTEETYGSKRAPESIYGSKQFPNGAPPYRNKLPNSEIQYGNGESPYGTKRYPNEQQYGTNHHPNPIRQYPINEPTYGSRQNYPTYGARYDCPPIDSSPYGSKNQLPQREPIYGTKQDNYIYTSKQALMEPLYGRTATVNNKVCDFYGQIHDGTNNPKVMSPPPQQRSGVLYGQLQRNQNAAPMQYQSYNQINNSNFTRGSRLTASVNDMYKRYQPHDPRYRQQDYTEPPNRPLPPIPNEQKSRFFMRKPPTNASDTESNASELQRGYPPPKNRILGK